MEQETDLSELKKLLDQKVSEAEQRLLKNLRSELSSLSQSLEHSKMPAHSHSEYLTKESWNKNIAALLKRVERLEIGED